MHLIRLQALLRMSSVFSHQEGRKGRVMIPELCTKRAGKPSWAVECGSSLERLVVLLGDQQNLAEQDVGAPCSSPEVNHALSRQVDRRPQLVHSHLRYSVSQAVVPWGSCAAEGAVAFQYVESYRPEHI